MFSDEFGRRAEELRNRIIREYEALKTALKIVGEDEKLGTAIRTYEHRLQRFGELYRRFQELMKLDDNQLRIQNSNEIINFESDIVYSHTGRKIHGKELDDSYPHPIRQEIRKRIATENEYGAALINLGGLLRCIIPSSEFGPCRIRMLVYN